jgi:hypothetical protein
VKAGREVAVHLWPCRGKLRPLGMPFHESVAARRVDKFGRRSLVPENRSQYATLCARAIRWCVPWTRVDYPGFERGGLALMPRVVTWAAVQHWRSGRRPLPADVALALASFIGARCDSGRALAAELQLYAASVPSRQPSGFQTIRARDGSNSVPRDGRWRPAPKLPGETLRERGHLLRP